MRLEQTERGGGGALRFPRLAGMQKLLQRMALRMMMPTVVKGMPKLHHPDVGPVSNLPT